MDNTLNFIVIGGITLESGTHIHGYHVILNGLVVKERILTTTTPIDTDRCNDLALAMRASRKLTDDIPDSYISDEFLSRHIPSSASTTVSMGRWSGYYMVAGYKESLLYYKKIFFDLMKKE